MRLVDANKLKEDVLDLPNCPNEFSDTYDKARILDLVDEQPAVDAVEVVRCKDCRFYYKDEKWCERLGLCGAFNENDFCSHGERRKDETD